MSLLMPRCDCSTLTMWSGLMAIFFDWPLGMSASNSTNICLLQFRHFFEASPSQPGRARLCRMASAPPRALGMAADRRGLAPPVCCIGVAIEIAGDDDEARVAGFTIGPRGLVGGAAQIKRDRRSPVGLKPRPPQAAPPLRAALLTRQPTFAVAVRAAGTRPQFQRRF